MDCGKPGFPVLHHLPGLAQTHEQLWDAIHTISSSGIPFSSCLQSSQASGSFQLIRVGSSHQGPQYWSFNFSFSPSNEYSRFISFRIDWFDLLSVQGALKSHLQNQVRKHQFFLTQSSLWSSSHITCTTTTCKDLTIRTLVSQVMPLLFNMLDSRGRSKTVLDTNFHGLCHPRGNTFTKALQDLKIDEDQRREAMCPGSHGCSVAEQAHSTRPMQFTL